nr:MAG TPA: hypothetical protein [Caudoviricetes sp.]
MVISIIFYRSHLREMRRWLYLFFLIYITKYLCIYLHITNILCTFALC